MNVIHLVLLQFVAFGLLGVPLVLLFDPQGAGYLAQQTERVGMEAVMRAYQWTLYSAVVLTLMFYLTGIRRRIVAYQQRPEVVFSRRTYLRAWTACFVGGAVCTLLLFAQSHYRHPGVTAMGLGSLDFAVLRIQTHAAINMNVYNLGLNICASAAVIIAVFYLKSFSRIVLALGLFVVLGTFSLAKAALGGAILAWLFFYLTVKRPSLMAVGFMAAMIIAVVAWMHVVSQAVSPDHSLRALMATRVFYGQFADLPYYFDYFAARRVSLAALLPPYVLHGMGLEEVASAAQLVMEYTNPSDVEVGAAGVANTLFLGEAYAWGGFWGVALAPFWIGAHFWAVTALFARLPKNLWTAFALAYLYHRMANAVIGGFSYFIFSGIHVMLLFIVGLIIVRELRKIRPSETSMAGMSRDQCSHEG